MNVQFAVAAIAVFGMFGTANIQRPHRVGAKASAARTVAYAARALPSEPLPPEVRAEDLPKRQPIPAVPPPNVPAKPIPAEPAEPVAASRKVQVVVVGGDWCPACAKLKRACEAEMPNWKLPAGRGWTFGDEGMIHFVDGRTREGRKILGKHDTVPRAFVFIAGKEVATIAPTDDSPLTPLAIANWANAEVTTRGHSLLEE